MFDKWIKTPKELNAPLIEKNFVVKNAKHAYIDICGLGFYELFINGKRVDGTYFKPAVSDYMKRNFGSNVKEETSHRIYYNTFELSDFLKVGENKLSILLGNGFFRQKMRAYDDTNMTFSDNLFATYELHIGDELITPDEKDVVKDSFIRMNNVFFGEIIDYSFNGERTYPFKLISLEDAKIMKEDCPRDVVSKELKPAYLGFFNGKHIYDGGENITGFVLVNEKHKEIIIEYSEEISQDGQLNFDSCGGLEKQFQKTIYLNTDENITAHPYFFIAGFRYFSSNVYLKSPLVQVIHSDVGLVGEFNSGNEAFDWLYNSFNATMLNNMHYSYPSDCPHRERLGYTGDGQITSLIAMMNMDARKFYRKWIYDILDCQDLNSGHIQHTAPFFLAGGGPSCWGGAIIVVPHNYYLVYKDVSILDETFEAMVKYIECMKNDFMSDGLIVRERDWGWCLGEWITPYENKIPPEYVNSAYFVILLNKFEEICAILNKKYPYSDLRSNIIKAIKDKYYDDKSSSYCDNANSANAYAIIARFADDGCLDALIRRYQESEHFDTGFIATPLVAEILAKHSPELLLKILSRDDYPSFIRHMRDGATTYYEGWTDEGSHDHHMFGGFLPYMLLAFLKLKDIKELKNPSMIENGAEIKYIFDGYIHKIKNENGIVSVKKELLI